MIPCFFVSVTSLQPSFTFSQVHDLVTLYIIQMQFAFYRDRFEELGARLILMTEDGSMGSKGFVTDAMKALEKEEGREYCDGFFACGPEAMLRAVDQAAPEGIPGYMSFEERMGCGFGACMGCSCKTRYGNKRICKDGPVLERREIIW